MSRLIPFGRWHPDRENTNATILLMAKNVHPHPAGFAPLPAPATVSGPVGATYVTQTNGDPIQTVNGADVVLGEGGADGTVAGIVSYLDKEGNTTSFAGTETKLWKIDSDGNWNDISRLSGGAYSTTSGSRWRFAEFGDYIIATNYVDEVQYYDVTSSTNWADLSGSPPKARYITVVRDFVVLGNLTGDNNKLHWSAINDATGWSAGTASSDVQFMPDGGPIQGLIGGEVGYVFQRDRVTRMTFVPGSGEIFQFDRVESGRGLFAPDSLVYNGSEAFYYGTDGPYRMSLISGQSQPIGVGKFRDWLVDDIQAGTQALMYGALSPRFNLYALAYVSNDNVFAATPDRMLLYDWTIDEAAVADIDVVAMSKWLTQGVSLDSMDAYGTMDTLPFSLDSPFWKGGAPILSIVGTDSKLAYLSGPNMAATFITADGQVDGQRHLIQSVRPHIDATDLTVEIAARERDGDVIAYADPETMEDTGRVPCWVSGNYFRARVIVPSGSSWTFAKGLDTEHVAQGSR